MMLTHPATMHDHSGDRLIQITEIRDGDDPWATEQRLPLVVAVLLSVIGGAAFAAYLLLMLADADTEVLILAAVAAVVTCVAALTAWLGLLLLRGVHWQMVRQHGMQQHALNMATNRGVDAVDQVVEMVNSQSRAVSDTQCLLREVRQQNTELKETFEDAATATRFIENAASESMRNVRSMNQTHHADGPPHGRPHGDTNRR